MEKGLLSSTTPFTPPTAEDDRLSWLRLIRSPRIGPVSFHRLIATHGSASAALEALPARAALAGLPDWRPCPAALAREELRKGAAAGLELLLWGDAAYPAHLSLLPDAPPALWVAGHSALLAQPALAVIGARNASGIGLRMAQELAGELADAGYIIVSGLARGIDRAAHEGAGPARTMAVVAGGADRPGPEDNLDLAKRIAEQGCLLSEQPPGLEARARHFPLRNRLISGLSQAVIVVEATGRSGTLMTVRAALDQGREVLVVPGHPLDPRSEGCNRLLREGATLIRHAGDVLEVTGRPSPAPLLRREEASPAHRAEAPPATRATARGGTGASAQAVAREGTATPVQATIRDGSATGVRVAARDGTGPSAEAVSRDGERLTKARDGTGALPPGEHTRRPAPSSGTQPVSAGSGEDAPAARFAGALFRRVTGRPQSPATPPETAETAPPARPPGLRDRILTLLSPVPVAEDQLLRQLGIPPAELAPALLHLEMENAVERRPGGLLCRAPRDEDARPG